MLNVSQIPYWDKRGGEELETKSDFTDFFTNKILPRFLQTPNVVNLGKREKIKLYKSKTKLNLFVTTNEKIMEFK